MDQATVDRLVGIERRLDGLGLPERPRWVDWTPTVTQTVAVAVNVNWARYAVGPGDTCTVQVILQVTGAGTAGTVVSIGGQPTLIQAAANSLALGVAVVYDWSATTLYTGVIIAAGATDWRIASHNTANYLGADPNFGLASLDIIRLQAVYERT